MARQTSSRRTLLRLISAASLMRSVFTSASATSSSPGCLAANDYGVLIATADFQPTSREALARIVASAVRPPGADADGPTPSGMFRLRAPSSTPCDALRSWAAAIQADAGALGVSVIQLGDDISFVPKPDVVHTPGTSLETFGKGRRKDLGIGFEAVGIEKAWSRSKGSPRVVIGIIDNGFSLKHPLLAPNLWINEEELSGGSVNKPDNGIPGDLHGADFSASGPNGVGYGNTITEDCRHGTDVAYVAAGLESPLEGCAGIAPYSKLMAVKFTDTNVGRDFDLARAIEYAASEGASIANISSAIPAPSLPATKRAIDFAATKDVLVVTAAGDDFGELHQFMYYPAAYSLESFQLPNQIVVMSAVVIKDSASDLSLSASQTYSKKGVHLAAPIGSHVPGVPGTRFDTASGSSVSAPYVSGIAALVKSLNPGWWSFARLRSHLLESGLEYHGLKDRCQSGRLVDADRAVRGPFELESPVDGTQLDPTPVLTWRKRYASSHCEEMVAEYLQDGKPGWRKIGIGSMESGSMRVDLRNFANSRGSIRLRSIGSNFHSATIRVSVG